MTRILCCHMVERRTINVYRLGKNGRREKQFGTLKRNKEIEYNKTIHQEMMSLWRRNRMGTVNKNLESIPFSIKTLMLM